MTSVARGLVLGVLIAISSVTFVAHANTTPATPSADLKDALDQKNKELKSIADQIDAVNKTLSGVQSQKKTLQNELATITNSVKRLNLGVQSSRVQLQKLGLEMSEIQNQIDDSRKRIQDKQVAISDILREVDQNDNENPVVIFLRARNLSDSLAEFQSLSDTNTSLVAAVGDLEQLQGTLNAALGEAGNKKEEVKTTQQTLEVQKSIAQDQQKEKDALLASTKNKESIYQQQLSTLQQQQDSITKEIDDLELKLRSSFDNGVLPVGKGYFSNPVPGAPQTQGYGANSFAERAYRTGFHNGVDFGVSVGTPVYAAADGVVMATGYNGLHYQYGRYVLIKHANNLATLYAHLSRNNIVSAGDVVTRGEVIGYSGSTGYATGPHLHFGVYWAPSIELRRIPPALGLVPVGVTVNPLNYL
ncbi:MAG: peptidoglycan DD-metalloendopeptidase family protein [Patescibacteria group bacterium]|nr:peptidoglycan DD-metalloendopeptidase family protein [Patescibacteria group bacterium]MDE2437877.1 peptidoglycan DD-metalloendopeptidase family protein [Patescibacteria group bacterium]